MLEFLESVEIPGKCWNSWKVLEFLESARMPGKCWNSLKVLEFLENPHIPRKSQNSWKVLEFLETAEILDIPGIQVLEFLVFLFKSKNYVDILLLICLSILF